MNIKKFKSIVNDINNCKVTITESHDLYYCSARYFTAVDTKGDVYVVLQSYATIVGIAEYNDDNTVTLYTDSYYSATTSQHLYKFYRLLQERYVVKDYVKMYRHSRMTKREYLEMKSKGMCL